MFRAKLDPATGELNILNAAEDRVDCRLQTGNLPSGVAMRQDGTRGYANNEANFSVTSMNIDDGFCLTLQLDIDSSEPPAPGSFEHAVLVGKLAFFTALGIPDNDIFGTADPRLRPAEFQGQAVERRLEQLRVLPSGRAGRWRNLDLSAPGRARRYRWTGCSPNRTRKIRACSTGAPCAAATPTSTPTPAPPRGAAVSPAILSRPRAVFRQWEHATPANPAIYDHGITQGASDALDVQTLWIFAAVRPLHQPQPGNAGGRCRRSLRPIAPPATGEPSGRRARSSTATTPPPSLRTGALGPRRHQARAGAAGDSTWRTSSSRSPATPSPFNYLEEVGTFDITNPLEIRDNAAASTAFGVNGFNVAVVAQYQLSRAVPAPRPSPDPGGRLPAARVGARWAGVSADDHDCRRR